MISFGELKNNLQQVKKFLIKMNALEQCNLTNKDLEQNNLRKKNPQIFLQLTNYLLIQYSSILYRQILQIVPNIKVVNDRKFIQNTFAICRKLLDYNSPLTPDQFFSNKYFEVKVQMIATLAKNIYNWDFLRKKNNQKIDKNQKKQLNAYLHEDDSQQQVPKCINLQPISCKQLKQTSKPIFQDYPKTIQKENWQKNINNPNIFPKDISHKNIQFQRLSNQQADLQDNQELNNILDKQKNGDQSQRSNNDFVTRQQFNQALQLLSTVNGTVNNVVEKFNNFQSSVLGWVNNINAKISIMEENIKMLKANL